MIPLHKSGDSTICGNYRPISLLPQFNKIFEKLLHDRLYCYLKDFGLLSEHQYGFRPNSSTALAVEDIYSNLSANHDKDCALARYLPTAQKHLILMIMKSFFFKWK